MAFNDVEPRIGGSGTVLLVDDDPDDALLFCDAAAESPAKLRVQWVGSGREALDYLRGMGVFADRSRYPHPDLVVLDLAMREISGLDFLRLRSASPQLSSVPVLVWSGSLDPAWEQAALALGATKFLHKRTEQEHWAGVVREVAKLLAETEGAACT
jgi:CheY-like chemotaxis protein